MPHPDQRSIDDRLGVRTVNEESCHAQTLLTEIVIVRAETAKAKELRVRNTILGRWCVGGGVVEV